MWQYKKPKQAEDLHFYHVYTHDLTGSKFSYPSLGI